jgi:MFS family permease
VSRARHGWLVVGALSITVTVGYGVLQYAFGVLLPSMHAELGMSRTEITGAFSLAVLVSAVAGLPVGVLLDRVSPRPLMTVGALAAALLVAAWSRVHTPLELYLVFAGLGLAMACLLYEAAFTVVAKWFSSRRQAALTTLTVVGATASLIFSPLTHELDAALGWRDALLVLAAILAAVAVPLHALALRRSPPPFEDSSRVRAPRQVLSSKSFWLLAAAFMLGSFSTFAIVVLLVSLLIHDGSSAGFAAFVAGLLGFAQLPGRLMLGLVGRRLSERSLPIAVFGLGAAALVLLASDRSGWAAIVFATVYGASNGMSTLLRATLVADLWGRESYGALLAALSAPFNLARAAAPVLASALVAFTGSYTALLWLLVAVTGAAGVAGAMAVARAGP